MKLINRFQNLINKTGLTAKFSTNNSQPKRDPQVTEGTEIAGRPPRKRINGRFPGTTV